MKINKLIEILQKAKEKYGNIEVLTESVSDVNVNDVCVVNYGNDLHVRLTDDVDVIYDYYPEESIEVL